MTSGAVTPLRPRRPCPECGRPSSQSAFPFCSPRCQSIDLGRWLTGRYVIPGNDEPGSDDGGEGARED